MFSMKHKIVAAVTTKNEEWIIAKTLRVLTKFCHKIVILDDDSSDKTESICKRFKKVDFIKRKSDNLLETGMSATAKAELLYYALVHKPDYVLMLDADETPTRNFIKFFKKIDPKINAFRPRMINLYKDEEHYRTDSFKTSHGININHNPFVLENPWRKTVLLKVDEDFTYTYDSKHSIGSVSKYHPLPGNIEDPVVETEDFYILHYGRLSKAYTSGEKDKCYAKVEHEAGRGEYEDRLKHHELCRTGGTPVYEKCDPKWFWK